MVQRLGELRHCKDSLEKLGMRPEVYKDALRRMGPNSGVFLLSDKCDDQRVFASIYSPLGTQLPNLVVTLDDQLEQTGHRRIDPSINAEFLFYVFLDSQNCDALVGDLEERYKLIHKKFGKRRADFWYWTQALRSVGPIILAWAKKAAVKPGLALVSWAIAKGILGHDSWLAVVVELYRKIRS